eukprot:scaffold25675_cov50-Attheya_sp.AAC.3
MDHLEDDNAASTSTASLPNVEYYAPKAFAPPLVVDTDDPLSIVDDNGHTENQEDFDRTASSRSQVETIRESMHELYYAKLYQLYSDYLETVPSEGKDNTGVKCGGFINGFFPPFLGHVVPVAADKLDTSVNDVLWEIREPYVLPAIRWVIRGLIHSNHLSQVDGSSGNDMSSLGSVIPNHSYCYSATSSPEPFDVLDVQEMKRRKRAERSSGESSSSEDEIEMSEYEKARAERVARNQERLKALGLA